jgi:hypothetical protein
MLSHPPRCFSLVLGSICGIGRSRRAPTGSGVHREFGEAAIAETFGYLELGPLIAGTLVAVKSNETWASAEDTSGVTDPATSRAGLRAVKASGPRDLVVSGGPGAAQTEVVFRLAGLMEVLEADGAAFFDHSRPPVARSARLLRRATQCLRCAPTGWRPTISGNRFGQ